MPELLSADHIEAAPGDLDGYNLVIISTDTTRADHIGAYGNVGVETPTIDTLARNGVLFSEAVTPSTSTLPAHTSLMTGQYPHTHEARANGTYRVREEVSTLAERLREAGYRTGAVISAFVLDSQFGLDQGFDVYHDDLTKGMRYSSYLFRERAAELTNEPAIQWLRENAAGRFFLWVHYFDPHAVYLPPEPFRSAYSDDLYDGEIAYVDSQIGRLLSEIQSLGVMDKTLIVYTSDHGEGLGEHSERTHSLLIYDSTARVPLIFSAPSRLPRGKRIDRQVSLVDVAPTVLSLLGEPVPAEMDGLDLTTFAAGPERRVVVESIAPMTLHGWAPLIGLRGTDFKYICAPTPELYDLRADARELNNLMEEQHAAAGEMERELAGLLGGDPFLSALSAARSAETQVDSDTQRGLSTLGYVHIAPVGTADSADLRNPKDMIAHWEQVQEGSELLSRGYPEEALRTLEECLEQAPEDLYARRVISSVYQQLGRPEDSLRHLRYIEQHEPNNAEIQLLMASAHLSRNDTDEAERRVEKALELDPESAPAFVQKGLVAIQRGNSHEAAPLFEQAITMDPGSTGPWAYNQLGVLRMRQGLMEPARLAFQAAIEIDALNGAAHNGLANVLIEEGKHEDAMTELAEALRFDPNQPGALATLASLVSRQGDQKRAEVIALRAIEVAPKLPQGRNNLGLIYRRQDRWDEAEDQYKLAILYDPSFSAPRVNLAQLYLRQGKDEAGIEQFRAAVESNPEYPDPIALANLGAYHFNLGDPHKAIEHYLRALAVKPDYALVHKNIASIYSIEEWNRPDLSAEHLRKSLELDPHQPDAQRMLDSLAHGKPGPAEQSSPHGQE